MSSTNAPLPSLPTELQMLAEQMVSDFCAVEREFSEVVDICRIQSSLGRNANPRVLSANTRRAKRIDIEWQRLVRLLDLVADELARLHVPESSCIALRDIFAGHVHRIGTLNSEFLKSALTGRASVMSGTSGELG